jgi:oxaloacetate decarboxylase (Na+ extruding) subunit alpha
VTDRGGRRIGYVDVTTRDAHQSLWATRMSNEMIFPFADRLDEMGFDWINLIGGAVFDVCVRYLREDPWWRMRAMAQRLERTPIDVMTRGQSLYTFEFFADDLVALNMRRLAANGIRRVTVYDALNDIRNLELSIRVAKEEGLYVAGGFVYTLSPVHTDDLYADVTRRLVEVGADSVFIKDPSGLLKPERVRTLVPAVKGGAGDVPVELHSHSLSGLAELNYLEAVPLGVDVLHTAISPLASGPSLPPTEYCVKHLGRDDYESDLSLDDLAEMADYFRGVAKRYGFPLAVPHRYDPALYRHQVPGGMISNLRAQLSEMEMQDREEEILEEAEQVRTDLGYPILVSPFAQYVITQSVLNVVQGERYKTIPVELRRYALGLYGRPAAPIASELLDRIVAEDPDFDEPYTGRAGDLIPPATPHLREERGRFDSDEDLLLAAFYPDEQLKPLFEERVFPGFDSTHPSRLNPLTHLLSELAKDPGLREVSIERPGASVYLRRDPAAPRRR